MSDGDDHLVRTHTLGTDRAMRVRHPLNPASDVEMHLLSRLTGMQRAHVSLARVPPGRESFIAHAHSLQEEWIYILEGDGLALIGEAEHRVGPGDFMGFPTDGTVHHLRNMGERDLVYLMGGESTEVEVASFPGIGKIAVMQGDGVRLFDEGAGERRSIAEWLGSAESRESGS